MDKLISMRRRLIVRGCPQGQPRLFVFNRDEIFRAHQ